MRTTARKWRIAATALAWLALAGPADAQPGGPGPGGPPPIDRMLDRHARELELTDAQREQVRAIAARSREVEAPLRAALRARRDEMHGLLRSDAPDADAVMAQADRVGEAETALHKQRLRTLLEVRALLTPEQREKLTGIFERGRERMERRLRKRFGDPPE